MSDDESFVILGSSPNSVDNFSSLKKDSSLSSAQNVTDCASTNLSNGKLPLEQGNSDISLDFKFSLIDNISMSIEPKMPEVNIARRLKRDSLTTTTTPEKSVESNGYAHNDSSMNQNSPKVSLNNSSIIGSPKVSLNSRGGIVLKPSADQGTLASEFLMGSMGLEELKEKVYSQFPSLSGSHINNEDILKLQNRMSEYVYLKDALKRTNIAFREYFTYIQKWEENMKIEKEERKKQDLKFEETIAKLNNDNRELKQEMASKIEHFQLNENLIKEDNKELNMKISEQSAQIQNMTIQIQKLEQQNLATFEYVSKEVERPIEKNPEYEYVSILEHKRITKNFERQLSELTAKNLDLEDMKERYLDEINCLKVNLTSAEELLHKAQADINILKSKDTERTELYESFQKERDEMKENVELLKKQVDIYNKDFQIERTDRQNLAEEKEQILSELKLLQRRNQQLIEEQQARLEASGSTGAIRKTPDRPIPTVRATPPRQQQQDQMNYGTTIYYECPICEKVFDCVDTLQIHVQECIDE